MQIGGEDGESKRVVLSDMVSSFLGRYVAALSASDDGGARLSDFVRRIYGREVLATCKSRSLLLFYGAVSAALERIPGGSNRPSVEPADLVRTVRSVRSLFSSGGAPRSMQESIKLGLALVLESSQPWAKVKDVDAVLQVLTLYPPDDDDGKGRDAPSDGGVSPRARARDAVARWVRGLGDGSGWAASAAPALASAFVSGQLVPYPESDAPSLAVDAAERDTGGAVCRLAALSSGSASEALWPAIFRGLGSPSASGQLSPSPRACRSLLLLEFGCRENAISGMGNGDLVLDQSGEFMMPPPPPVESVLGSAADLILARLSGVSDSLLATTTKAAGAGRTSGATRSALSSNVSALVAVLVSQLRVLNRSYPSSDALSSAVDAMLGKCADALSGSEAGGGNLKSLVLLFGALTCGGTFSGKDKLRTMVAVCNKILSTELSFPSGIKKDAKQACRSIFQYGKSRRTVYECLHNVINVLPS